MVSTLAILPKAIIFILILCLTLFALIVAGWYIANWLIEGELSARRVTENAYK